METPSIKSSKKLDTIKIKMRGGENEYVKVDTRVKAFLEMYPTGMIQTKVVIEGGNALLSAKVTPYKDKSDWYFTGHSYGKVAGEKSLEKLETVSVGRALAFLGIGIVEGGLASADEINNWEQSKYGN